MVLARHGEVWHRSDALKGTDLHQIVNPRDLMRKQWTQTTFFIVIKLSKRLCVFLLVTQSCPVLCDTVDWAHQAPLSTGFSRQEYWDGLLCPSPKDLPNPGMEPRSPASAGKFFTVWATREALETRSSLIQPLKRNKNYVTVEVLIIITMATIHKSIKIACYTP